MSGPLKYAATHFPEMVDIPSNHPPMTDEEIQRFEEIARELAELSARSLTEKTGEPIYEDEDEEEEVNMSGPLKYAATHFPEMVDIPSANYPPTTEEEIKEFKELSRELAELSARSLTEKTDEPIYEDEDEEEEVNMSGPLKYAATHYPEMVDIPVKTPPLSEEEIRMFDELSEALAQRDWEEFREKKQDPQKTCGGTGEEVKK